MKKALFILLFALQVLALQTIYAQNLVQSFIESGPTNNSNFGCSVSTAGDVNNDGYDDIIVGAYQFNSSIGQAYIYYGGGNLNNTADVIMKGEAANNYFGIQVATAGDVNGDGYDDIIIGAYGYSSTRGRAYIFYGGENMDSIADVIFTGEATNDCFGVSVSTAGDVNNDGYDDVIVGANGCNTYTGKAYLYYGGSNMDNTADVFLSGESIFSYFGVSVSLAGDLNNDDYDDVIVGSKGRAYIYYGGNIIDNIADDTLRGNVISNFFGNSVSSAGDVNNDGYDDVVVGALWTNSYAGQAFIFFGGNNMDNIADVTILGETFDNYFGVAVSTAGDLNDDGYADVIVGASGYNSYTGRAYIFFGGIGMDNTPDIILNGESTDNRFGISVFTAGDVNGDGNSDIIIGAKGYSPHGKAYIYSFIKVPTISTQAITNISSIRAFGNGNITSLGMSNIASHGVCWNTMGSPTIADSKTDEGALSAPGSFTSEISVLTPNTTYHVKAYATNASGTSYGEEVTFTTLKQSQTITFNALTDFTYGDNTFNLAATTSSGLTITYSSSNHNIATISGNTVTLAGAGSATITASQAGNSTYYAAESIQQPLTVNKALVNANADDATKVVGTENPPFTITYNGFVNSETEAVLNIPPIVTTDAVTQSPVGSYALVVSGGSDNNYDFSYTNGTLVITEATSVHSSESATPVFYPNPVNDYVILDLNGDATETIAIYNNDGQLILTTSIVNRSVDVSSLKPGIYFMKTQNETFKFIKE
jgi:hypothetical protein